MFLDCFTDGSGYFYISLLVHIPLLTERSSSLRGPEELVRNKTSVIRSWTNPHLLFSITSAILILFEVYPNIQKAGLFLWTLRERYFTSNFKFYLQLKLYNQLLSSQSKCILLFSKDVVKYN